MTYAYMPGPESPDVKIHVVKPVSREGKLTPAVDSRPG